MAVGVALGFPLIMGSRLLLNLREAAIEESKGSSEVLSSLVFAPGQDLSVQTRQFIRSLV